MFTNKEICKKTCEQEDPLNLYFWYTQFKDFDDEKVKDIFNILEDVVEEMEETISTIPVFVTTKQQSTEIKASKKARITTLKAKVPTNAVTDVAAKKTITSSMMKIATIENLETTTVSTMKPKKVKTTIFSTVKPKRVVTPRLSTVMSEKMKTIASSTAKTAEDSASADEVLVT